MRQNNTLDGQMGNSTYIDTQMQDPAELEHNIEMELRKGANLLKPRDSHMDLADSPRPGEAVADVEADDGDAPIEVIDLDKVDLEFKD